MSYSLQFVKTINWRIAIGQMNKALKCILDMYLVHCTIQLKSDCINCVCQISMRYEAIVNKYPDLNIYVTLSSFLIYKVRGSLYNKAN